MKQHGQYWTALLTTGYQLAAAAAGLSLHSLHRSNYNGNRTVSGVVCRHKAFSSPVFLTRSHQRFIHLLLLLLLLLH